MKLSNTATSVRANFTQLVLTLSRLVQELQNELLTTLEHKSDPTELAANLDKLSVTASEISNHLTALAGIQTFTLFEVEYILFCDLIICGSEMASYLSDSKSVSKIMFRHAAHWQKLIKNFKPLLEGVVTR
jgi:hypothetical protein